MTTTKDRIDRVTTRTGDKGHTSLSDGRRYHKYADRIELVGTLDEANSWIGLLIAEMSNIQCDVLFDAQSRLLDIGAIVTAGFGTIAMAVPGPDWAKVTEELETEITNINQHLMPLREFLLPGGGRCAATAHVARAVVRRAERRWWAVVMNERAPGLDGSGAGPYLNRLSDYLFVVARNWAQSERLWNR